MAGRREKGTEMIMANSRGDDRNCGYCPPGNTFGEGRDSHCYISGERLAKFVNWMYNHPISLVRSPPRSGKTTLAQILVEHFRNMLRGNGAHDKTIRFAVLTNYAKEMMVKYYWKRPTADDSLQWLRGNFAEILSANGLSAMYASFDEQCLKAPEKSILFEYHGVLFNSGSSED